MHVLSKIQKCTIHVTLSEFLAKYLHHIHANAIAACQGKKGLHQNGRKIWVNH